MAVVESIRFARSDEPRAVGFVHDGEVPTRFGPGLRMHLEIDTR